MSKPSLNVQCFVEKEVKTIFRDSGENHPKLLYVSEIRPDASTYPRVMHAHEDFVELILICSGSSEYLIHDKKVVIQAGDLLVSGIMDNKVGESRTAHARGQVYAQVRAKLEIFTPYEQSDYVLRGIARRRYLRIFGVEVPLQIKGIPDGPYRVEHTAKEPTGLAALLPVTLREDCYLLMREVKKTVTQEEAMRQAEKALALREQDWAEAKIISREAVGTESPEGYTLAVEYLLEKQIAVEAPVQTEERQKAPIPEGKAR